MELPEVRVIWSWARRSIASRYRQSALHVFWTFLQPISIIVVYAVVFRQILRVDGDGAPYLSFVVAGMALWRYFSLGLGMSTCLIDEAEVMSKVRFRREIVPLSACVAGLIDLAIGTVALVVVAALQGAPPALTILALGPIYLALICYTAAAAIVVATVTVFARDVALAMPTVQQLLFFATPVMYASSHVEESLGFLGYVNPMWSLIESARDATLRQTWPAAGTLALHLALSASLLAGAIWYLRSIEHRIVDIA